jgi:molecular chaperone GrpE
MHDPEPVSGLAPTAEREARDERDRDSNGGSDEAEAAVESDLALLMAERDEMKRVAQRLQADFENYKKRMLREQTAAIERANERLLMLLLPTLDSFELAQQSLVRPGGDDRDPVELDKLRAGVLAAIRQLGDTLAKEGLERIDALGSEFDPSEHEAVMHDDTGDAPPIVADVLRTGYRLKGRVVRPAMVKVGGEVDRQAGRDESRLDERE